MQNNYNEKFSYREAIQIHMNKKIRNLLYDFIRVIRITYNKEILKIILT